MSDEPQARIGIALFIATLIALAAIAAAEAFGFAFFDDQPTPLPDVVDRHANIYAAVVQCLNEPSVITVAGVPAADCKPRRAK